MCMVFWNLWTLLLAGLNKRTTSEKLQEAFSKFGEVVNGNIIFLKWCYLSFPLSLSLYTHTRTNACNFVEHALKILAMWRYFGVHGTLWCYLSKKKMEPFDAQFISWSEICHLEESFTVSLSFCAFMILACVLIGTILFCVSNIFSCVACKFPSM